MAETTKPKAAQATTTSDTPSDSFDPAKAQERGYFGTVPHDIPDSAYSLETGPDSPNGNFHSPSIVLLDPENPDHMAPLQTTGKDA